MLLETGPADAGRMPPQVALRAEAHMRLASGSRGHTCQAIAAVATGGEVLQDLALRVLEGIRGMDGSSERYAITDTLTARV